MASDTKNVRLGVCTITYAGTDLGLTMGGVEVDVTTTTHEVTVDQYGKSPINEIIMSRKVSVKVPLAETTLENLVQIMPGASLVTDKIDSTKKKVVVTNGIGTSLLATAAELVLHPQDLPAGDHSEDFTVPLAATAGELKYSYQVDQERVFSCTFNGYPDPATKILFVVGDETASAV